MGKKDKDKKKDKKDKKKKDKKGKDKDKVEEKSDAAPPAVDLNDPTKCSEHPSETLTLFCESCSKCICLICQTKGAHRGVTHACTPIPSMYSQRVSALSTLIDTKLNVKKDTITTQIERLNALISSTRNKRLEIEIDTRRDFDGILQRLKDEESRKLSILYVDLTTLRSILSEIEGIIKSTAPSPNGNASAAPAIEFLSSYDRLFERASILSNKYIKKDYSAVIDADDFPQETKCRREMLMGYSELLKDHEVKNTFIDYMLSERKQCLEAIEKQKDNISEMEGATKEEMKHWMELTDRFVSSLDAFKLKCVHCGIPLHQQSVNSFCDLNTLNEDDEENVRGNLKKLNVNPMSPLTAVQEQHAPNQQEFGEKGSGLHYFVPFN